MNATTGTPFRLFASLLRSPIQEEQALRIQKLERNIILPVKVLLICSLFFYFFQNWNVDAGPSRVVAFEVIRRLFFFYLVVNVLVAALYLRVKRLPLGMVQWLVFAMGLLDGLLLAALIVVTGGTLSVGGYDSLLYWVFLALILHNALSIPLATLQIMLNVIIIALYLGSAWLDIRITREEISIQIENESKFTSNASERARRSKKTNEFLVPRPQSTGRQTFEDPSDLLGESLILRAMVLILETACFYGVEALIQKQKKAEEEEEEFAQRQEQLQTAGRMAAEIAHQIKNPLSIINNAAFALQRGIELKRENLLDQISIIREEVERADRIITEVMGYAQLGEGKVEKLDVVNEIEEAIRQVFPAAAKFEVKLERNFDDNLPSLLVQKKHLSEVLANLLQNAREAMNGKGVIKIVAENGPNGSVIITVEDTGPGIAEKNIPRVFESYFSTKEKGSGIGLAIVKHNTEFYGGKVKVESKLGNGAKFILQFPAKTLMRLYQE